MKRQFVLGLWKIKMKRTQKAFTLLEVLISITLLTFVLLALYKSTDLMRASNLQLFHHLIDSKSTAKAGETLYKDLMYADHNITITTRDKFNRINIFNTTHSLYGLSHAKVVWLVYKNENTLLRVEGGAYTLPLKNDERVEIDVIAKNMELFKAYRSKKKDKLLVLMQLKGKEPQVFMVQNIPPKPSVDKNATKKKPTVIK